MTDNNELLLRLGEGDESAKTQLVENNMGLVYNIAGKFRNRGCECEDLIQIGAIGLIKAVKKFDLSYNVQFSTYAVPMIIGEIKRFLRDDGTIKVSRSLREIAIKGRKYEEILLKKLGRKPTINEISAECNIEPDLIMEAFEASHPPESLQAAMNNEDEKLNLMGLVADDSAEDDIVDRLFIQQSLDKLSEREREIIILRYFKGKTQTEIAKKVGVSQVQISRIEKKALLNMRTTLAGG